MLRAHQGITIVRRTYIEKGKRGGRRGEKEGKKRILEFLALLSPTWQPQVEDATNDDNYEDLDDNDDDDDYDYDDDGDGDDDDH